ncbi:GSCFA domain-containing protein [uncultured Arcticibacterium sp.]|uniref:GSCFA domain-containing protein n=1 Tax=uncultured Arcticibacterium sp. TaxID=2173042 RepID=UPI0030F5AA8B
MNFRTEIELSEFPFKVERNSKILTIGSCFSDNIGNYLVDNKMECMHNPFGVVFNPVSIFRLLTQSINQYPVKSSYFTENDGIWYHYDFHSKLFGSNKKELESELNLRYQKVRNFLKKADYLFITMGTAYAYRLKQNAYVVSNCHKKDSELFKKEMLTNKEIGIRFTQLYEKLKQLNPKIKIVFTVSPVRHTRDTLQGNNLSKSTLRLASHYFTQDFKDTYYFPAYEILLDDLRDYRYYADDMIHVNETGQKYVLEHFRKTAFSSPLNEFIDRWQKIQSQLKHKPFHSDSDGHQKFLKNLVSRLEELSNSVNVDQEMEIVKAQLI